MSSKSLVEQKVYVAVGMVVQDSKSVLMCALHNHSAANNICPFSFTNRHLFLMEDALGFRTRRSNGMELIRYSITTSAFVTAWG